MQSYHRVAGRPSLLVPPVNSSSSIVLGRHSFPMRTACPANSSDEQKNDKTASSWRVRMYVVVPPHNYDLNSVGLIR